MTHSSDDKNYVRAVLSYLGIDFDEADIVLSVCHCQSDELSFTCNIKAIELKNAVDLYVDSISENEIEALNAYSALFDHGLASKSDQRFASIRSTGNLTFSTAF